MAFDSSFNRFSDSFRGLVIFLPAMVSSRICWLRMPVTINPTPNSSVENGMKNRISGSIFIVKVSILVEYY